MAAALSCNIPRHLSVACSRVMPPPVGQLGICTVKMYNLQYTPSPNFRAKQTENKQNLEIFFLSVKPQNKLNSKMTEHGLNSQTEVLYQTVNLFEFLGGDKDASAYMYCQLTLTFTFQSGINSHIWGSVSRCSLTVNSQSGLNSQMMGFCIKTQGSSLVAPVSIKVVMSSTQKLRHTSKIQSHFFWSALKYETDNFILVIQPCRIF